MNIGAKTNLLRERKDAGEEVQPQDHKSGFRPTAEGAKGGEANAAIPEQKRSAGNQANLGIPRGRSARTRSYASTSQPNRQVPRKARHEAQPG